MSIAEVVKNMNMRGGYGEPGEDCVGGFSSGLKAYQPEGPPRFVPSDTVCL